MQAKKVFSEISEAFEVLVDEIEVCEPRGLMTISCRDVGGKGEMVTCTDQTQSASFL